MSEQGFRYVRTAGWRDHVWLLVAAAMAAFLTVIAIWSFLDPTQRTGNPVDDWGIWVVALISWWPATFLFLIERNERLTRLKGEPFLLVSREGLEIRDWRGRTQKLPWADVDFWIDRKSRPHRLWVKGKKLSGTIDLDRLDASEEAVIAAFEKASGRRVQ